MTLLACVSMTTSIKKDDLPDDIDALKRLLVETQTQLQSHEAVITRKQKTIDRLDRQVHEQKQRTDRFREKIVRRDSRIEILEELIARLKQRQFGKSSEKQAGQLQLFNEAELVADETTGLDDDAEPAITDVLKSRRRKSRTSALPAGLPEVVVRHTLDDNDKGCHACGETLKSIGIESSRQLGVIPQQHFIIIHECEKYACSCGETLRTAAKPKQPIPGSVASAPLLGHIITSKLLDGLPLYRQEKMARREGLNLPRTRTARWSIQAATVLQPIYNLLEDSFFSYDIVLSDETGIQVLKEDGRSAQSKSYLWIRRGGPPDRPVVLVDYNRSKSGDVVKGLLSGLSPGSYLVSDGASNFNDAVRENRLKPVLCNDHARRRFNDVLVSLKKTTKRMAEKSIAAEGVARYRKLYQIERETKDLEPDARQRIRAQRAAPLWDAFIDWAEKLLADGVTHAGTLDALKYLTGHADGLRRYCDDGRLPISNIQSEHIAKTIAVARKNFLFADTPAGARSSALNYSLIETARANHHHPQRYLSVLLTELPNVTDVDGIEALLPWNITPEEIARRYALYPAP